MLGNHPQALVLDLDGTMIDTEGLALNAWCTASAELKLPIRDEFFSTLIGLNSADIAKKLREEIGDETAISDLRQESWKVYEELLSQGIRVMPGVLELLDEAAHQGIKCAVATSSHLKTAEQKLSSTGLLPHISVLTTGDEVTHGKPNPEIFLRSAERLEVSPAHCWAAEDSAVGVKAASNAGMQTWMVVDRVQPTPEIRNLAWKVVDSMHKLVEALRFARQ